MSKVLVVEDEKILRDLMADELVKAGYEVKTAADGGEGWQLIQEFKPAVVLLDLYPDEVILKVKLALQKSV